MALNHCICISFLHGVSIYQVWSFWVKRSRLIRCRRLGRLTWPFTLTCDLPTWISTGIIYSLRTIYLPSLELLGQSVVELSVAQGMWDWLDLWPTDRNIYRDHLLIKDYLTTKFEASGGKALLSYQLHKVKGYQHPDRHVQSNFMPLFLLRGA